MNVKRASVGLMALLVCAWPMWAGAETVKLKVETDRPVVAAGKEAVVRVKVEVVGAELPPADRPPVNLALIIDKSGSMRGDRIRYARKGAMEAIRRLGSEDFFSVVVFDSTVMTLIPAGRLKDVDAVERIISGIEAGGTTNIHGGMEAGLAELEKHVKKGYLNRAVLLSDGLANVGPTQPEAFDALGRRFSRSGVVVSTVGLGQDYNEQLLASLAQASEGNNYFVDNSSSLPEIFEDEIGHLVSTVATGITIRIQLSEGVKLKRVLGRPHREAGRQIEIDYHDLAGGATKYSVLELVVPAGEADAMIEALEAKASYRRVQDNEQAEASARSQIRYTVSETEAEASLNAEVQDAWVELYEATVQEEVLDLVAQGDREGARRRLNALPAQTEGLAGPASERLMNFTAREDGILQERGYSRQETLTRRAGAYQVRNQQTVGRVEVELEDSPEAPGEGSPGVPVQRQR